MKSTLRKHLLAGQAIPALPLALNRHRRWDETSQRALVRYYIDAGAGGLAVAVHSTQFAIREPRFGLLKPVLALAADTAARWPGRKTNAFALIAGICGRTRQALLEAEFARQLGYQAGLLSLGAWRDDSESHILTHCAKIARVIPLIGFYLQAAVGGRSFSYAFWRKFTEIPELVAIKIAPFNRYQTIDVVRAVIAAGRTDVALYTGNDDNIIADLLTPFRFDRRPRFISGGLLGQWGVWTHAAVALHREIKQARQVAQIRQDWWTRNAALTDANAAIFDAAHGFHGCIPGIHEVLRRQGLVQSIHCLDPKEGLSPGQAAEITRVSRAYPWLTDDAFVEQHLAKWRA